MQCGNDPRERANGALGESDLIALLSLVAVVDGYLLGGEAEFPQMFDHIARHITETTGRPITTLQELHTELDRLNVQLRHALGEVW